LVPADDGEEEKGGLASSCCCCWWRDEGGVSGLSELENPCRKEDIRVNKSYLNK
jgi:hypothetical protein